MIDITSPEDIQTEATNRRSELNQIISIRCDSIINRYEVMKQKVTEILTNLPDILFLYYDFKISQFDLECDDCSRDHVVSECYIEIVCKRTGYYSQINIDLQCNPIVSCWKFNKDIDKLTNYLLSRTKKQFKGTRK